MRAGWFRFARACRRAVAAGVADEDVGHALKTSQEFARASVAYDKVDDGGRLFVPCKQRNVVQIADRLNTTAIAVSPTRTVMLSKEQSGMARLSRSAGCLPWMYYFGLR